MPSPIVGFQPFQVPKDCAKSAVEPSAKPAFAPVQQDAVSVRFGHNPQQKEEPGFFSRLWNGITGAVYSVLNFILSPFGITWFAPEEKPAAMEKTQAAAVKKPAPETKASVTPVAETATAQNTSAPVNETSQDSIPTQETVTDESAARLALQLQRIEAHAEDFQNYCTAADERAKSHPELAAHIVGTLEARGQISALAEEQGVDALPKLQAEIELVEAILQGDKSECLILSPAEDGKPSELEARGLTAYRELLKLSTRHTQAAHYVNLLLEKLETNPALQQNPMYRAEEQALPSLETLQSKVALIDEMLHGQRQDLLVLPTTAEGELDPVEEAGLQAGKAVFNMLLSPTQ